MNKREFLEVVKMGVIPPIYAELPYTEPASVYMNFSGPETFLLESVKGPNKIARYSFIGFDPYMRFILKDGIIQLKSNDKIASQYLEKQPLKKLRDLLSIYSQKPLSWLPPFQGGVVGILSYDFVRYIENIPQGSVDDLKIPDADFFLIDRLISFDHFEKKAWAIVCPGIRDMGSGYKIDWKEKFEEAEYMLTKIKQRLYLGNAPFIAGVANTHLKVTHGMKKKDYIDMVRRAKEYISAGDIFQANLSLRVSAFIGDIRPWSLYTVLREINPSPFACFIDFGSYAIVSSSPERLLMIREGDIETRPIAGTRPRGKNKTEDNAMRSELLLNEKERAEHIMLIDLERNDLGRVSHYGSIEVNELMITEDYSHVIHIVSNIRGRLLAGKTPFDSIRATFPGGTITGVPKVRCMEIIEELEPHRRGPYTGSAGYIGFSGNADFNIIIRTFVIKAQIAYIQAGSGVVADSDPEREYEETLKKAEALIETLYLVVKNCYN